MEACVDQFSERDKGIILVFAFYKQFDLAANRAPSNNKFMIRLASASMPCVLTTFTSGQIFAASTSLEAALACSPSGLTMVNLACRITRPDKLRVLKRRLLLL